MGGLIVEAYGGTDGLGGPVDREVGEEIVSGVDRAELAVAIAPADLSLIQAARPAGESLSVFARSTRFVIAGVGDVMDRVDDVSLSFLRDRRQSQRDDAKATSSALNRAVSSMNGECPIPR